MVHDPQAHGPAECSDTSLDISCLSTLLRQEYNWKDSSQAAVTAQQPPEEISFIHHAAEKLVSSLHENEATSNLFCTKFYVIPKTGNSDLYCEFVLKESITMAAK